MPDQSRPPELTPPKRRAVLLPDVIVAGPGMRPSRMPAWLAGDLFVQGEVEVALPAPHVPPDQEEA